MAKNLSEDLGTLPSLTHTPILRGRMSEGPDIQVAEQRQLMCNQQNKKQ